MNNRKTVVGIGEILWDILPEGKKLGGAPANFAYHASQFGLRSIAVSAVGRDELGRGVISQLQQRHLGHVIETVEFPTGTVGVTLHGDGIPSYEIKEGVAWDNIPFSPEIEAAAKECAAVCFGSLAQRSAVSRQTIYRFLDAMPKGDGSYRIFDINLRQDFYSKVIISESMSRCDILKINDEELAVIGSLFGYPDTGQQDMCRQLLGKYNLKMLILTCGASGSYVFTPGDVSYIDTPRVEVADTVGAGDSFTAAFVSSLLHGKSVKEAHQCAVNVSAYVCTQNGAMPVLPESLTSM